MTETTSLDGCAVTQISLTEAIKIANLQWWKNIVCYQIYPKSFYDTNSDGIGDLKGVIAKLDYLKNLGINTIWLNPVYRSPMVDNGYDISDYEAIADEYGTMKDLELLIHEAKQRGISIVMDLVINHTSDEHPWFLESRTNKESPKRDWYIWRDPKDDGSPPNNWRSIFGGSAWEYDPITHQYYLHVFSKKQPDLNWENPEMRQALYKMVNFWLEKGIGGFRLDAITFIKKRKDFSDSKTSSPDGLASIAEASLNQPGILEFLQELKRQTFANYDIFTVAEAPGVPVKELPRYIGDGGVFDMLFEFDHVNIYLGNEGKWYEPVPWTLIDLKKIISDSQNMINNMGWGALYFENHDLPRSVNTFVKDCGPMSAKMLATIYLLLRGTPFIYQGQELGMTNIARSSIAEYDDIATLDQYRSALCNGYADEMALQMVGRFSRDNARTPMQWNDSSYAGFSDHKPWLGVNSNYCEINVEKQVEDSTSVFHYYRKLIEVRKSSEVILSGTFELLLPEDPDIFAYTRTLNEKRVLVLTNFSDHNVVFHMPNELKFTTAKLLLCNSNVESDDDVRRIALHPYEARVYELN